VLRREGYRPKRITLFVGDLLTSCLLSPIVEETVKLLMVEWCVRLPKNYSWVKGERRRKKHRVDLFSAGEDFSTSIAPYVTTFLAASWGIKLADNARRVACYTKAEHVDKAFFAACRGFFPVRELCGFLTGLQWARRHVLGIELPLWKILLPSVFIHAMANFRGMKPVFKWNSATPWSEMQLNPPGLGNVDLVETLQKNAGKAVWAWILLRVLGFCVKNFYRISRQAKRKIGVYGGDEEGFMAEVIGSDLLKQQQKKK